jgi:hypothetical protein
VSGPGPAGHRNLTPSLSEFNFKFKIRGDCPVRGAFGYTVTGTLDYDRP